MRRSRDLVKGTGNSFEVFAVIAVQDRRLRGSSTDYFRC